MDKGPKHIDFAKWLISRGRTQETADLYVRHLRQCAASPQKDALARISNEGLAPNTRHTGKAALKAWAVYTKNKKLEKRLKDIKLPPAVRIKEKRALEEAQWKAVKGSVLRVRNPYIRATLQLVCMRGFRIGCVCRLSSRAVSQGLSTGLLVYKSKGRRHLKWTVTDALREPLGVFVKVKGWKHVRDLLAPRSALSNRQESARQNAQREFSKVLIRAGLDGQGVSLHTMRRTYAWHFMKECERRGIRDPIVKLTKHMSWANINTAMQYVDQSEREELDELAALMSSRLQ